MLLENMNDGIFSNFEPCCLTDSNNLSKLPWLKHSLVLFYLNISSLYKHFDELQELVSLFPTFAEIICLSEVKLKKELSLNLNIPDCSFIFKPLPSIVGGVAMYISNNCSFKIFEKYNLGLPDVEDLWIELTVDQKKHIIGIIYRHPKYAIVEEFLLTVDETLKIISSDNKLCYILGDLNINTYDTSNNLGKNFVNLTRSNAFISLFLWQQELHPLLFQP